MSRRAKAPAGIDAAVNGDTVLIKSGTYAGNGNRDIDFMGKAITVKSENGSESCIIDCEGTYVNNHRGFYFRNGESRSSVLEGFTITNGYVVVMCEAGAGIYISGASPTIRGCIIINNYAELEMGSLCYCYGGGIYIGWESNPLITDCVISDNSTDGSWGMGGGIYCEVSEFTLRNSIISNNTAAEGGGICCAYGNSTIDNCTIADNLPGGILLRTYDESPITTIANSIIWGNSPNQIYANDITKILTTYSDISGGWTGTGNINIDPCFANPGSGDYHLRSQAGRWEPNNWVTDAVTSPCIDAGDPNSDWTAELWPHGKRINMGAYGGTPEASMSLSTVGNIANLDNDPCDTVDFNDLKLFVGKWLDEEVLLPEDLDRNGTVNFVDYAIFAQQWLSTSAEPGIEYQISSCEGMGMSSLGVGLLDETRFTVTVEGRYIHFEDTMSANCCAKKLWLDMTVTGNLITINENESGGYCYCTCNYPVTATLGPFEPGTYTLRVYNHSLIGSTTVVIE